jgi:hypothetical protein
MRIRFALGASQFALRANGLASESPGKLLRASAHPPKQQILRALAHFYPVRIGIRSQHKSPLVRPQLRHLQIGPATPFRANSGATFRTKLTISDFAAGASGSVATA